MKISVCALAVVSCLSSTVVIASQDLPFTHEASVGYTTNTEEVSDGTLGVNYRYYANPVVQNATPYGLNRFLAQTSNLGINYSNEDVSDTNFIGIDGTYVFDSKWFVGLAYQNIDSGSFDYSAYVAQLGYYFDDSSSITLAYADGDENIESSYGLEIRRYISLDSTAGIDLTADWLHVDSENVFGLNADWYLSNSWSVGAHYERTSDDDVIEINTAYWLRITESISANFEVAKVVDADVDGYGVGISVVGRF